MHLAASGKVLRPIYQCPLWEKRHSTPFIRGPSVEAVGPQVEVLATLDDGTIVAVREGTLLGTAFHPEVSGDIRFHRYFLRIVQSVIN